MDSKERVAAAAGKIISAESESESEAAMEEGGATASGEGVSLVAEGGSAE